MKLTIMCMAAVAAISLGGCAEGGGDHAAAAMTESAMPPEDAAQDAVGGMQETSGDKAGQPGY
jgi:hypothetical protein